MAFTLHDRQTVEVAAQSSHEHRIAIEVKVMGGDGGGKTMISGKVLIADVDSSLLRGDVFQHDAQSLMAAAQWNQMLVDEGGFPIKNIHLWICDLPMNEQGHVDGFHAFEHRGDPSEITTPAAELVVALAG